MANAVFEIFSEELPATLQKTIVSDYFFFTKNTLKDLQISADDSGIFIGITPNRMVLKLLNCDIDAEKLKQFAEQTLRNFSKTFPRTMLYPQSSIKWLRPIRSLFLCIDNNVIEADFFGLKTSNGAYIDKFEFHECKNLEDYENLLKKNEIEIDYNKRLEFINKEVTLQNNDYRNNKLLEEIAGMSEYCVTPIISTLNKKFDKLPFELIELVLRENQRYVVFRDKNSNEIKFIIFGDKITANEKLRAKILKGHEKVINARLEDAVYYYDKDKNRQKEVGFQEYKHELIKTLSQRTFIDDLSFADYLKQQENLANEIVKDGDIFEKVKELIWNTKLDLATGVVAEFPELQGIIGAYYFGYNFNPYKMIQDILKDKQEDILYFYLIDRLAYIDVMYKHGKNPTGSGDKYKVKARMDDVVLLFLNGFTAINTKGILRKNEEIRKLFFKRLQKHIEDKHKDIKNIKQFAEIATKVLDRGNFFDIEKAISFYKNEEFLKIYKRINGYTKNIEFNNSEEIKDKIAKKFKNNDLQAMKNFLDNEKISGNNENEKILKYLEATYFNVNLPVEFLETI